MVSRASWFFLALLVLVGLGWVSTQVAVRLWPYSLASRGALVGAAFYLFLALRARSNFTLRIAIRWSVLFAFLGSFWCCVPIQKSGLREWLDLVTTALGASVVLGAVAPFAVLALARAWGIPSEAVDP